jgi:hypothetical protein
MSSLRTIEEKLNKLLAVKQTGNWFKERDGQAMVGIPWETLRKMRRDPKHKEGWRYMAPDGKKVSSKGYTIRRKVQWNQDYLNGLFKNAA